MQTILIRLIDAIAGRRLLKRLERVNLGRRLAGGFVVLLAFTVLVGMVGISNMRGLNAKVERIVSVNNAKLEAALGMRSSLLGYAGAVSAFLLAGSEADRQNATARMTEQRAQFDEATASLERLLAQASADEDELGASKALQADATATFPALGKVVKLNQENNDFEALLALRNEVAPLMKKFEQDSAHLVAEEKRVSDAAAAAAGTEYELGRNLCVLFMAIAVILSAFTAWLLTRSIMQQLGGEPRYAVQIAQQIAHGDLSVKVEVAEGDEGSLLGAMKSMSEGLAQVVGKVRAAVDLVAAETAEIANGNQDLSNRTERQAGSLEETAASMEQLTSTVNESAVNAKQANELATAASVSAARGGEVVGEVVTTMEAIAASSRRMAEIISVIDGIAFQTNILALNAAVEAARAGDQGRGFAVVAGEVRNLAQRSAQAAREIKAIIDDSTQKVTAGSVLVKTAGDSMAQIVQQVQQVTTLMGEITHAAVEQSSGITQVNNLVSILEEATQRNAALVEESAAAAGSLKDEAQKLATAVGVFRVDDQVAAAVRHERAPAPKKTIVTVPGVRSTVTRPARAPTPPAAKPTGGHGSATAAAAAPQNVELWEEF